MAARQPLDLKRELLDAFDQSARVTEYLASVVPDHLWHAKPAGGERRSIAAIVAHMQSVRRMFAKMGGAPVPPALDRLKSTPNEARKALKQSREALLALFTRVLDRGEARVKGMPRRVVNMMLYLIQHDTHHRGQISMLMRELGHRLSREDIMRLWGWNKLP